MTNSKKSNGLEITECAKTAASDEKQQQHLLKYFLSHASSLTVWIVMSVYMCPLLWFRLKYLVIP